MAGTVTVTGQTGPNEAVTALVLSNVSELTINMENSVINVKYKDSSGKPFEQQFDVKDENTVTVTKSGLTWTVTIAA